MEPRSSEFHYNRYSGAPVRKIIPTNFLQRAFLASLLAIPLCAQAPHKAFEIIDSIQYSNKGDTTALGMKSYTIFYSVHLWDKDLRKTNKQPSFPPTGETITRLVSNLKAENAPVIYDIEHWPLDIRSSVKNVAVDDIATAGKQAVRESIEKMVGILRLSKKVNPGVAYGYYACVPLREYWAPVQQDAEGLQRWKDANSFLQPIADAADVLCPSIYAFYQDRESWVRYAKANLEEAKRLAKGKPVYAYLWPKYHNSNKDDGKKFIEAEFWRLQLETVRASGVAGLIIWDSRLVVATEADAVWDETRPWWVETKAFMKRLRNE